MATEKWAGRGMDAGGDPTGSALGDSVKQGAGRIIRSHITSPRDSLQIGREMWAYFQADLWTEDCGFHRIKKYSSIT